MSAQYFLDQLQKRWNWGNLDEEIIATRSADILTDWARISIADADDAAQLLRRKEYHKGNFMPIADEIDTAVSAARAHRNVGKSAPQGAYRPTTAIERYIGLDQYLAEASGQAWQAAVREKFGSLEAWHKAPHNAASEAYLKAVRDDAERKARDLWNGQNRVAS